MEEVLVSINCITYNHEKYIADAIESFLVQKTNFKFEILIHDDASTDKTTDIIRDYSDKYPDVIKPIIQTENQYSNGLVEIFSLNLKRAKGRYIAICEGDDYWTDPYKLQKQIDYMEHNKRCGMCFHASEVIEYGKGKIGEIKPYNKNSMSFTDDIISGGGTFIGTSSILYRKEILDDPPKFYLNSPVVDYPLQILASTKYYAYYINEFMSVYRVGVEGSWTNNLTLSKNSEEKIVNLYKGIINMLIDFNGYSNGIYNDSICKEIQKCEFMILKTQRKLKQLKMSKYKTIYDSLDIMEKIKIYAYSYFPNTYRKLSKIKGSIQKR